MPQLVECVPNFSEGRDPDVLHQVPSGAPAGSISAVNIIDGGFEKVKGGC